MHELKHSTKLIFWPSPQDYNEAIQNPHANFQDAELRGAQVHTDKLGLPRPMTGAFASVYRMSGENRDIAVRCFLRNIADQEQRYDMISDFVQHDDLPYTVGFEFIREGIRVNSKWYPALKMEYVHGTPLDAFVRENARDRDTMLQLAGEFVKMTEDLARDGIAHGDLQHGNILVLPGNELRLVDYDGMFVPGMEGMPSNEVGHPNYQHPRRSGQDFGPYLDNFSAWVIYASLKSLSLDPLLFRALQVGDDCLLFRRDDFLQPGYSHAFALLEANPNEEIVQLARCIRWHLTQAPSAVPPLTQRIPQIGELPKVHPVSKGVPDWISTVEAGIQFNPRRNNPPAPQAPSVPPGVVPMPQPLLKTTPRALRWRNVGAYMNPFTSQWVMLFNPLVWILVATVLSTIPEAEKIITQGADTTATVDEVLWVGGKGSHYQADYHYVTPDGGHYGSINLGKYSRVSRDDTRPVRFDKLNPSNHVIDIDGAGTVNVARREVNTHWTLVIGLLLVNLFFEIWWFYKPLKHRELISKGRPVRAKISRKFTRQGSKGATYFWIEFKFNAASGPVTTKQEVKQAQYDRHRENDSVIVVYDQADPAYACIYEYALYEAI